MKTTEIGGDTVTFYYKNADGDTVKRELDPNDKRFIERLIDKGDDKGKFDSGQLTLYWSVEFD